MKGIGYAIAAVGGISGLVVEIAASVSVGNEHGFGWVVVSWIAFAPLLIIPFVAGMWVPWIVSLVLWFGGLTLVQASDQKTPGSTPSRGSIAGSGRNASEIRELQALYANRVAFGAQLIAEFNEINRVYGMLRDRGADADQQLVDHEKAANREWMLANPWLTYHEPHLDRDWFDSNRPDRLP